MNNIHAQGKALKNIYHDILICLLLVLAILAVYWQVGSHEFINFDDPLYVTKNYHVQKGITLESIKWAFSFAHHADRIYWHPITWLSHMLDCELFGLNAGMQHLTSVLFHILNTLLLFFVIRKMTRSRWKSAFVAALFALHPINVDSVAWIAERKTLLSTFFWMLSMLAYLYYSRRPNIPRYTLISIMFALGLMAKPMLVTLPFVLLLLDYWPLGRIDLGQPGNGKKEKPISSSLHDFLVSRVLLEKIPLIVLSLASVYISSSSLQSANNIISTEMVPMGLRIANAIVSYIEYIRKMILPYDLAIYYPFPETIPYWKVLGASLILAFITVMAVRSMKRAPYFIVGWLWYLGTLVPVSGIVQTGLWPEMADRWAYVPLVGLFVIITWGVPDLFRRVHYKKQIFSILTAILLTALTITTFSQLKYWKNDFTISKRALDVNPNNYWAYNYLGLALEKQGRMEEAIEHYKQALKINPEYLDAHVNLGLAFSGQGRENAAITQYKKALKIDHRSLEAHLDLGVILLRQGKLKEAIKHYQEALEINPACADAYNALGVALIRKGKVDDAIGQFRKALRIDPSYNEAERNLDIAIKSRDRIIKINNAISRLRQVIKGNPENPELYNRLGNLYKALGDLDEAIEQYQKALSIKSDYIQALNNLSLVYADRNEYHKSLGCLKKILQLMPNSAKICYNIACIYARQNKIDDAVHWLKKAINKGFNNWDLIEKDPDLKNIKGTKFYNELVAKAHGHRFPKFTR